MIRYQVEMIDNEHSFNQLQPALRQATTLAIDIETINWWNRADEKISIVQIGFREGETMRVAICDLLGDWHPESLREPLEISLQLKVMHNASFDAVKLAQHYGIRTSPVYDTMLAARRNGEKRCSLKDQVERHLGLQLEKSAQRSDWSRRPLSSEQLEYAALDAVATLMLYERQQTQGLRGDYELKSLPGRPPASTTAPRPANSGVTKPPMPAVGLLEEAIDEIVRRFPGRYTSRQLAATIAAERTGIIGWILDQAMGPMSQISELTALAKIDQLLATSRIQTNPDGRLAP